jgi:hypothetical protein
MKFSAYAQRLGVSDKTAWRAKRKTETIMREPTISQALVAHERAQEVAEDATC